eukprot:6491443-Amphidinium_carterae.4
MEARLSYRNRRYKFNSNFQRSVLATSEPSLGALSFSLTHMSCALLQEPERQCPHHVWQEPQFWPIHIYRRHLRVARPTQSKKIVYGGRRSAPEVAWREALREACKSARISEHHLSIPVPDCFLPRSAFVLSAKRGCPWDVMISCGIHEKALYRNESTVALETLSAKT